MPKGLREIRNRIKSVKSTGQITRAMQLVASSKMKRAQDSARAGRAYAELLGEILDTAQAKVGDFSHPLLTKRDVKVRGILLVTPDKGMAGALNGNLIRLAAEQKDAVFVCIGRKGAQALARSGRKVLADFPVTDRATFNEVRPAAEYLIKAFTEGTVDTVEVLFAHFKNTMVQTPRVQQLLPADSLVAQAREFRVKLGLPEPKIEDDERDMLFEPSAAAILSQLPALFFKQAVHQAVLESKASEFSARMVAMKAATDNAKKIGAALSLEYNKARQAAITQEILELTAGAAAQ
ncbi:MAG: ATP synthase F1 subunit gamma [Verrucomicrobia bacterium]|jgi:F-type H+-transporting ATPase subunit gamma|nr:ATP synthase F1 subunit gamma [Verrucomicrobiota bacterium]